MSERAVPRKIGAWIEGHPFTAFLVVVVLGFAIFAWRTEAVKDDAFRAIAAETRERQLAFEAQQRAVDLATCQSQQAARASLRQILIDFVLSTPDPADPTKRIPIPRGTSPNIDRVYAYIDPGGQLAPIDCPLVTTPTTGVPQP